MKEKPILFSGPMVTAILEGRKTQTRRRVKIPAYDTVDEFEDGTGKWPIFEDKYGDWHKHMCPFGEPGSQLWVREKWIRLTDPFAVSEMIGYPDGKSIAVPNGSFKEGDKVWNLSSDPRKWKWRPSIHMPRWASRILLEVTGVRVERLQEITASDAFAEGCSIKVAGGRSLFYPGENIKAAAPDFIETWEALNGKDSWAANPWVWVIEFKRLKP